MKHTATLPLTELLGHLQELSEKGLSETDMFEQTLSEYTYSVLEEENKAEIIKAIEFLRSNPTIGKLSIPNLMEQLEEKL